LVGLFKQKARALLHGSSGYRAVDVDHLEACLKEARTEVSSRQVHTDIMETQKKRVFAAVKANFDVEKKTFVDILLKNLKFILLEGHTDYVEKSVLRSKTILDNAREDESVTKLREDLLAKEKRLKECMSLLHDVPFPLRGGKKRGFQLLTEPCNKSAKSELIVGVNPTKKRK